MEKAYEDARSAYKKADIALYLMTQNGGDKAEIAKQDILRKQLWTKVVEAKKASDAAKGMAPDNRLAGI